MLLNRPARLTEVDCSGRHTIMKKIDIHIHLTYRQLPKAGPMYFSTGKDMLPHLDELGIGHAVLMSGGESSPAYATNRAVSAICKNFPNRYFWMCNLDDKHPETVYSRLAKYKEQGAVGVGEIMLHKQLDDPFMQSIFDAAEKLDMPVLMHMSPVLGMGYGVVDNPGLPLLEQVLKSYPKLRIIGHSQPFWHEITKDPPADTQARNQWGEGPVTPGGRVPQLLDRYPNLYCDLSANSGGHAIMRDETFGCSFLERYQDRIMFGSDMFNREMTFPLGGWLDQKLRSGELSQTAYNKVCYHNANRILSLGL